MLCSACRRKVDPMRSFCRSCGSAVFADEQDVEWRRIANEVRSAASTVQTKLETLPSTPRPARPRMPTRPARPMPQTSASAAGCLGSLIRLALFFGVIWYVGSWLVSIPEVRALRDAFLAGSFSDEQLNAAIAAVREQVLQFLGASPSR